MPHQSAIPGLKTLVYVLINRQDLLILLYNTNVNVGSTAPEYFKKECPAYSR
jgi:hypothetical protein